MIITISGGPGTGTTSVAKELHDLTGFKVLHVGELFRAKAELAGMPLQEYLEHANANPDIHKVFDKRVQEMADAEENCIVEGRIAGFVINSDFDVQLTCPPGVVAQRVAKRENKPYDLAAKETHDRMKIEQETYKEIYGFELYHDTWPFDMILNSDMFKPDELGTIIATAAFMIQQELENYDYS